MVIPPNHHFEFDFSAGWPDWAIYRRLGDFLKHMATIILTQIAQIFGDFLGDFWKMAQILIFYVIKKI